jgi:lipoprotein-releasing system permease protein
MVILLLIVVVAAFNIVGSLTMIVIEKQRDVGVLRAMGVSRRAIRQIFLAEGLFIGLAGSGLGTAVGLGLSVLQREYGLVQLSGAESFLIDAWPVDIQAGDVAIIGLLALLLCVAAALYPAWRAAAIEPAKAVNLEG